MSTLTLVFAVVAVLATCLASIAVWAPRRLSAKLAALGSAALLLPASYVAQAELLGRPKPVAMEWLAGAREATVLGSVKEEGKRILVWLKLEGDSEPRAYALPWSRDAAEQLQGAERDAAAAGSEVRMRSPLGGETSLDAREPRFYAAPQPPLPPKETGTPAQLFTRPDPA